MNWQPLADRLDINTQLLRAILSAIQESAPGTNGQSGASSLVGSNTTVAQIPSSLQVYQGGVWSVEVSNTPLDVRVVNTPTVQAQQSGSWNVGITGQPIGVNVQNAPTVQAQQSGSWSVSIGNQPISVQAPEESTFIAFYDRIAPAANKQLATLWNGSSTHRIRIQRITIWNFQETAVTGVAILGELRRITAHSNGTVITPLPMDTNHSLPSGITATHNATVTTGDLLLRFVATGEEIVVGAAILQALLSVTGSVIYEHRPPMTPLTLRPNQGITLQQITNTTIGSVSISIVFTVLSV